MRIIPLGITLAWLALTSVSSAVAAPPATYYSGVHHGYVLTWSAADLQIHPVKAKGPLFSAKANFLADSDPDMRCDREGSYQVLSVVGPYVSLHQAGSGYCEGTAHPYAVQTYRALDVRRADKPVKLTDLFPEKELLTAFLGDRVVKKALAGQRPSTLKGVVEALAGYSSDDCAYGFSDDLLERFAFHHLEGDRVAVRVGLSHGCEANRGGLTQLGLLLKIPPALRSPLTQAAQRKHGFLTANAPKGQTSFSETEIPR